jgi:hypothetical protein
MRSFGEIRDPQAHVILPCPLISLNKTIDKDCEKPIFSLICHSSVSDPYPHPNKNCFIFGPKMDTNSNSEISLDPDRHSEMLWIL